MRWCGRRFGPTSRSRPTSSRHGSSVLEQLIKEDGLLVVGAEYSLETGVVDFFDGVPTDNRLGSLD